VGSARPGSPSEAGRNVRRCRTRRPWPCGQPTGAHRSPTATQSWAGRGQRGDLLDRGSVSFSSTRREGSLGLAGESLCSLMRTGWTHSWCTWTGQRGEASTHSSRSLGGRREEGEGNTEPPLSQYTSSCRLTSSVGSLSCKSCCTVTLGYRSERWTASCPARPTTWRLLRDPECETCAFCTQRSHGAIIAPQKTTPWPIRVASGCRRRAAMPSSSLSGSSENGVDALEPPLT
jgi:hypothetical protein